MVLLNRRTIRAQDGASYLEASLTVLLFVIGSFIIIDATRYFTVYTVFYLAAQRGLDIATKSVIEVDTSASACSSDPSNCAAYQNRFDAIVQEVERLTTLVSSAPGSGGYIERIPFSHYYEAPQQIGTSAINREVAFMRPGEKVLNTQSAEELVYPLPRPFGTDYGQGWPQSGETWDRILQDAPLTVIVQAKFKPFTPFVSKLPIRVQIFGYRRTPGAGRAAAALPPGGVGTPGDPVPTPTPTPDPGQAQTPTPAPTPDCHCCEDEDNYNCPGAGDVSDDLGYCPAHGCGSS